MTPRRARAGAALGLVLVAAVAFVYAWSLLFSHPGQMASADSHYHFALAREIWAGRLVPDVASGLPWTVLRDMPVDHYWGYHVLISPFAAFSSPETGMKAAACVMFTLVFVSLYALLASRGVPFAWAWALLPAMFSTQDWRYLQLRGGQLMVPLLLLLLHFAFFEPRRARRRVALVLIAFLGMLSYHGAVVLLPFHIAGAGGVALWARARGAVSERSREPLFTAAGIALGLTVNPYMDARASTWRFAAYHIVKMGGDPAHLYDDLEISEFRGFPAGVLLAHPEWIVLLAVVLAGALWVGWRLHERRDVPLDVVVLGAVSLLGVVLTATVMRVREYSVPLAFAFAATLARVRDGSVPLPAPVRLALGPLLAGLVPFGLVHHWESTWLAVDMHLPTAQFDGARPLLDANGARPILNIAEADYCTLKWQKADVVCVQGLSRYFLYPDRPLFDDVWALHDRGDTAADTAQVLGRFFARGVRLVTTHESHPLARWAEKHPETLQPRFMSRSGRWMIWQILPSNAASSDAKSPP